MQKTIHHNLKRIIKCCKEMKGIFLAKKKKQLYIGAFQAAIPAYFNISNQDSRVCAHTIILIKLLLQNLLHNGLYVT